MSNFDSHFTVVNDRVYLGQTQSEQIKKFTSTMEIDFPDSQISFALSGKTGLSFSGNTASLQNLGGTLHSYNAEGVLVDSVTIPNLFYNESISLDGTLSQYPANSVVKGDLTHRFNGDLLTYATTTISLFKADIGSIGWDGKMSHDIIPGIGRKYIFSEGLSPVLNRDQINYDGEFCVDNVIDVNASNDILYIKQSNCATVDDVRTYLFNDITKKTVAILKAGSTLNSSVYNNKINVVYGGHLEFVPSNAFNPEISIQYNALLLDVEVAAKEKEYRNTTLNLVNADALPGLAKFTVKGQTLTTPINPWNHPEYRETVVPTTKGTLSVQDESNAILSSLDIPFLYGNSITSDSITESKFVKKFSEKFSLKSTWNWVYLDADKLPTDFGDFTQNRRIFQATLPESEFLQAPLKTTVSSIPNIISDFSSVYTYEKTMRIRNDVAPMVFNFHWDSTQSCFVITVSVWYSHLADTDVLTSFFSLAISQCKSYFYYALATPVERDITELVTVQKNSKYVWTKAPDTTALDYKEIQLSYPSNLFSSFDHTQLASNINALQLQSQTMATNLQNMDDLIQTTIEQALAPIGTPDGSTDNTQILQDAIDASRTTQTKLELKGGTYVIHSPLVLQGGEVIDGGNVTTIKLTTPNVAAFDIIGKNVVLKNLTILVPQSTVLTGAVHVHGSGNHEPYYLHMENVTVIGGIFLDKDANNYYFYNGADRDQTCGVLFDGDQCFEPLVQNCFFQNMWCGIENKSGASIVASVLLDYVVWGIRAEAMVGDYTFYGHNRSLPDHNSTDNKQKNLTKGAIYCNGSRNKFSGFLYDAQRSDCFAYFDEHSAFNSIESPNSDSARCNYPTDPAMDYNNYYEPDGKYKYEANVIIDYGKCNRIVNSAVNHAVEPFVGAYTSKGDNINTLHDNLNGMQDNALANAHLFGSITCNAIVNTPMQIEDICKVDGGNSGFQDGVILQFSENNFIEIVIDIHNNPIKECSRFGIQWGKWIPKEFDVFYTDSNSNNFALWNSVKDNTQKMFWRVSNYTSGWTDYVCKIKIVIKSPMKTATYNNQSLVSISHIWATDGRTGGRAFLSKGGGTVYGDIKIGDTYIKSAIDAGKVFEPYASDKGYQPQNKVFYEGSCYINKTSCTGIAPTNTAYWQILAQKGTNGTNGYTPQRGTDYWTTTDVGTMQAELHQYIDEQNGVYLDSINGEVI